MAHMLLWACMQAPPCHLLSGEINFMTRHNGHALTPIPRVTTQLYRWRSKGDGCKFFALAMYILHSMSVRYATLSLCLVWRAMPGFCMKQAGSRAVQSTNLSHDATGATSLTDTDKGAHLDNRYHATSVRKVMKSMSHPYSTIHSCI